MNKLPQNPPSKKVCPRNSSCWACNGDDCAIERGVALVTQRIDVVKRGDGEWIPLNDIFDDAFYEADLITLDDGTVIKDHTK